MNRAEKLKKSSIKTSKCVDFVVSSSSFSSHNHFIFDRRSTWCFFHRTNQSIRTKLFKMKLALRCMRSIDCLEKMKSTLRTRFPIKSRIILFCWLNANESILFRYRVIDFIRLFIICFNALQSNVCWTLFVVINKKKKMNERRALISSPVNRVNFLIDRRWVKCL